METSVGNGGGVVDKSRLNLSSSFTSYYGFVHFDGSMYFLTIICGITFYLS